MKLEDLLPALQKLDGLDEKEFYIFFPNGHKVVEGDFVIEKSRYKENTYFFRYVCKPPEEWPVCMVGGHDTECMCNLGFTPRWRNK